MAYGAVSLRGCYAMPGIDLAYVPARHPAIPLSETPRLLFPSMRDTTTGILAPPLPSYAMSGTDLSSYAISGTNAAHDATPLEGTITPSSAR
eukprot:1100698-Rhodomonas_salina.1